MTFPRETLNANWSEWGLGGSALIGNMVLLCLVLIVSWRCKSPLTWLPCSCFTWGKPEPHVWMAPFELLFPNSNWADTWSTRFQHRSRFYLIHRASELHEYKMRNRRDCRCFLPCFCTTNSKVFLISLRNLAASFSIKQFNCMHFRWKGLSLLLPHFHRVHSNTHQTPIRNNRMTALKNLNEKHPISVTCKFPILAVNDHYFSALGSLILNR